MAHGGLELYEFAAGVLQAKFLTTSLWGPSPKIASVEYLAAYLGELGAKCVIHELHYVDRHYLDDYSDYYSRSFFAPRTTCERLHFFDLERQAVDELLEQLYRADSDRRQLEKRLEAAYLGFVVKRPLDGASIGRTVLKTYPVAGRRHYGVVRPYKVNVAGIRLVIEGLAYQEQDRGAAVCASTALWSALQRVAYVAGHRTPTPSAITRAAASPFPASHGLHEMQMAAALAHLGYVADIFVPAENRALFRAMLVACIDSQLPAILLVSRTVESGAGSRAAGHAVTVTGYSDPPAAIAVPGPRKDSPPLLMKGASVEVIYVHDDNLGSHAHYELRDSDDVDTDGNKKLLLYRGRSRQTPVDWWTPDEWEVCGALIPKPSKLRLPIENLFFALVSLRGTLEDVIFAGAEIHYAPRFASGTEYKRSILASAVDSAHKRLFLAALGLPRFIGVLAVTAGDQLLCDLLLDVSEIERVPEVPPLIGLVAPGVPMNSIAWASLDLLAKVANCPFIAAPPSPLPP
jgi:hypothetical protein